MVNVDLETGVTSMTDLCAIIAGGISEAKSYLKHEIKHASSYGRLCAGISAFFIFAALTRFYDKITSKMKKNELTETVTR